MSERRLPARPQINWLRWATVTVIVVSVVLPGVSLLLRSFAFRWHYPDVLPGEWGLDAWTYTIDDTSRVFESLGNSLRIALLTTTLALLVGMPAARALGQHQFRGKRMVEWILMMPIIVPTLVAAMGIHIVFIRLGLTATVPGVALVHLIPATPYFVLVMSSVFANYSPALEETARTLGASKIRVFRYVTLARHLVGTARGLPLHVPDLVVAVRDHGSDRQRDTDHPADGALPVPRAGQCRGGFLDYIDLRRTRGHGVDPDL